MHLCRLGRTGAMRDGRSRGREEALMPLKLVLFLQIFYVVNEIHFKLTSGIPAISSTQPDS